MRISDWSSDVCSSDLHQLIGLEDIGADLVTPADLGLRLIFSARRRFALLELGLVHPRLQHSHRGRAVLVLRTVVLRRDDDAGRDMGDTHRRIGRVDMLSARARGAIGVDLEVALVDLNLDIVVDHRIDPDARKARVAARSEEHTSELQSLMRNSYA